MRIAVCRSDQVAVLDRYMPSPGVVSSHARRYARQAEGVSTFLVAWQDDRPVGSCEIRWNGCAAPEVRAEYPDCPEINGLGVWPESMRSRGIGTALIREAELRAGQRGSPYLGLGVADDNPRAAALYARLGYRPVVTYLDRWSYQDSSGTVHDVADRCTFLIKWHPAVRPVPDPGPAARPTC